MHPEEIPYEWDQKQKIVDKLDDLSDRELMVRTQDGMKQAYEVLVQRYCREAVAYCISRIHNAAQAQDIVQDCFADIYVARADFCLEYSFRTWLFALIRNKSVDYLRQAGRMILSGDAMDTEIGGWQEHEPFRHEKAEAAGAAAGARAAAIPTAKSPEDMLIEKEQRYEICRWMQELKEEYRQALYLFCIEELSYEEIARRMGKTTTQVKMYIFRGRKKIQKKRREMS